MTQITLLVQEMAKEYAQIVGRQLTPTEYLQFRNQAMIEIQNGFTGTYITESVIPVSNPNPIIQTINSESVPITNVQNSVTKQILPQKTVTGTEVITPSIQIESEVEEVEEIEEIEDPFFALIDKLET